MKRLELIANVSVQEDIVQRLEAALPGFQYTLIPAAHGRGAEDRKLGTTVWPEENFVLFSYQEDSNADLLLKVVRDLKQEFPREGIKAYSMNNS